MKFKMILTNFIDLYNNIYYRNHDSFGNSIAFFGDDCIWELYFFSIVKNSLLYFENSSLPIIVFEASWMLPRNFSNPGWTFVDVDNF